MGVWDPWIVVFKVGGQKLVGWGWGGQGWAGLGWGQEGEGEGKGVGSLPSHPLPHGSGVA